MVNYGSIQVIDRKGWSKSFPLQKALTMVGSATFNDVVISDEHGDGIAPVHFQLIRNQTSKQGFRIINLINEPLLIHLNNAEGSLQLPAKGSREINDGDMVHLGGCILTFYLQVDKGKSIEKRSENIGVKLEMPGVVLKKESKLTGLLTLKNFGSEKRSQFEIDVEGLPKDCYQVDPAPLLYPGGEEKLQIRFFHLGNHPVAGECPIQIHATAVNAYPQEKVIIPVVLDIEPVFQYSVDIFDSLDAAKEKSHPKNRLVNLEPISQQTTLFERPQQLDEPSFNQNELLTQRASHTNAELDSEIAEKIMVEKNQEPEMDWWADDDDSQRRTINDDPLAGLKRSSRSKLSIEKSNIQVLKADIEDQTGMNETQDAE